MDKEQVIFRIFLSIVMGGIIGFERERKNRPAGFRTHILVCIGAAIAVMIQLYIIEYMEKMICLNSNLKGLLNADISRMASQVITGVGFLGAGTIIRDKGDVKGLTTAASIWVVACIGISIGLGFYFLSIVGFLGLILALFVFENIEGSINENCREYKFYMEYLSNENVLEQIVKELSKNKVKLKNIKFIYYDNFEKNIIKIKFITQLPKNIDILYIIEILEKNQYVNKINILKDE